MSGSSSEIFETYQQEYNTLRASISQKLSVDIPNANPDQKRILMNQVERDLEEADEIISHMEIELQSLPLPVKTQLAPRIKTFKDDVKKYKTDFKTQKSNSGMNADRDTLLGGGRAGNSSSHTAVDMDDIDLDQRDRLMRGTEKLQDGSRRLEEAKRVALETESIGISTLEDLNRQREQMLRTRDTLQNADTWITKSTSLLKTMQRRLATSQMLGWIMIGLLVVVIILVIVLKWFS